jgi:hypothetical protein
MPSTLQTGFLTVVSEAPNLWASFIVPMRKLGSKANAARSSTLHQGKRREPKVLPSEEWHFESLGDDDVPTCWLWEYWREACGRDPEVRAALANAQQEVQANDTEIQRHDQQELLLYRVIAQRINELPGAYTPTNGAGEYSRMLAVYGKFYLYLWSTVNPLASEMDGLANISPDYFPKRSFLSLDPDLRKICGASVTSKNAQSGKTPLQQIPPSTRISEGSSSDYGAVQPSPEGISVASFSIDWDYANHFIEEAFRDWLVQNRGDRSASVFRGLGRGKSPHKKLRRDLKALSALRLLEHYGSREAASEAVKQSEGFSLYADKSDWSKSKAHALSVLGDFCVIS